MLIGEEFIQLGWNNYIRLSAGFLGSIHLQKHHGIMEEQEVLQHYPYPSQSNNCISPGIHLLLRLRGTATFPVQGENGMLWFGIQRIG